MPDDVFEFDPLVCPIDAAPDLVTPTAVGQGQEYLALLTGRYLPTAGIAPPAERGATVVAPSNGEGVTVRDYLKAQANFAFASNAEQTRAFVLGQRGSTIVTGPSGMGGKSSSSNGHDDHSIDPARRYTINDDKSFASPVAVTEVGAMSKRNMVPNLGRAIKDVSAAPDFVDKQWSLDILERTKAAFEGKGTVPDNVRFSVSNAAGNTLGIAQDLSDSWSKDFAGVTHDDGRPLVLEWDPMQPQARTDLLLHYAAESKAHAAEPLPFSAAATPTLAASAQAIYESDANSGSRLSNAAPIALDGAPVLAQQLSTTLDNFGVRGLVEYEAEARIRGAIESGMLDRVAGPGGAAGGALFVVTVRSRHDLFLTRAPEVAESVFPVPGGTAADAYGTYLGMQMLKEQMSDPSATERQLFYWYQGGHFEEYNPHADRRLDVRPEKGR